LWIKNFLPQRLFKKTSKPHALLYLLSQKILYRARLHGFLYIKHYQYPYLPTLHMTTVSISRLAYGSCKTHPNALLALSYILILYSD